MRGRIREAGRSFRLHTMPALESPASSLPQSSSHRTRCGDPRPSKRAKWRAVVLVLVHLAVIAHVVHWKMTGRTLSPLEPSESMQTLEEGLLNAGFILFTIAILATLIVGRFFCGWACHLVAYQDLCAFILKKLGLRPKPLRSRLLVLVPLGTAFYMFVWPTILRAYANRPAPPLILGFTTDSFWRTFPGPAVAVLTLLVDGFLIVWFLGAKGFCTYGCPYGAIFGLADRASPIRIRVTDACEGCGHCTVACTSNVLVHREVAMHKAVVDPGCMKCLDCVSVCPKDALYVGFGPPALASGGSRKTNRVVRKTYDLSWQEELVAAATFCFGLYAYRELYHKVPFLLAIGLAVITAVSVITLGRSLRRGNFTFQHVGVTTNGRLSSRGRVLVAALGVFLALGVHSAVQQYYVRDGVGRLAEIRGRLALGAPTQREEFAASLASFETADRVALSPDGHIDLAISSLLEQMGEREAAIARARAAVSHEPTLFEGHLQLADLLGRSGKNEEAKQVLLRLLEIAPGHPGALRRLGR